jgi:hypothetical protein
MWCILKVDTEPGQVEKFDYEYRCNGTANLFAFVNAHEPWRHVEVTDQRTAIDFAECVRDLVDLHYPTKPSASAWYSIT